MASTSPTEVGADPVLELLIEASRQTSLAYQFNPGTYTYAAFTACKAVLYETKVGIR
jgi:hypothetical protein